MKRRGYKKKKKKRINIREKIPYTASSHQLHLPFKYVVEESVNDPKKKKSKILKSETLSVSFLNTVRPTGFTSFSPCPAQTPQTCPGRGCRCTAHSIWKCPCYWPLSKSEISFCSTSNRWLAPIWYTGITSSK